MNNFNQEKRDTEGVDQDIDPTQVISSFRKSLFRDVCIDYNLDLRLLVKKQISIIIIVDLSLGHIKFFRGDTRGLCFSWGYKRSSARRVRKELINHNLYLFT